MNMGLNDKYLNSSVIISIKINEFIIITVMNSVVEKNLKDFEALLEKCNKSIM
jgi:predicted sugar kinase